MGIKNPILRPPVIGGLLFTGIVEANSHVLEISQGDQSLTLLLQRPADFNDIKIGDSIACNGVCLTVEEFNDESMQFTIGFETLQITGWTLEQLAQSSFNLERSLKFGDRIHGHLVSGHVDNQTQLKKKEMAGDCLLLDFELPDAQSKEVWKKSSVAINGVSLTVNWVENSQFQVCLVPETLKKTNLQSLTEGDWVNIETDYYMKGLLSSQGEWNAQST